MMVSTVLAIHWPFESVLCKATVMSNLDYIIYSVFTSKCQGISL